MFFKFAGHSYFFDRFFALIFLKGTALPPFLLHTSDYLPKINTENGKMSSPPFIKDLLSHAIQLAECLSVRIPKSESLQRDCKQTAANLRTWRKQSPPEMEFLLKPTGDKTLYRAVLSPLSQLLCVLCMSLHTQSHRN